MELDIHENLEQIGYVGPLLEKQTLEKAIQEGSKSEEYTRLVEWLSKELQSLCKLDDYVNAITSSDDSGSFLIELSSFLKEICCPHKQLTKGTVDARLNSVKKRELLLVYLMSELQAARMIAVDQPKSNEGIKVQMEESTTANELKAAMIALGFQKPSADITAKDIFSQIETTLEQRLKSVQSKSGRLMSAPLFTGVLTEKQWKAFSQLHVEMSNEYQLRREMLLKRLDVTIQSFQWSGKAKIKVDEVAAAYLTRRKRMLVEPTVYLSSLLAAREDLTILEKTSNSNVRKNTQCAVNKILIGRVPDRGGRPNEQKPPPPEMPSWQKRTDGPQTSGRGGGRGGGDGRGGGGAGGGGRVQGAWSGGSNNYRGGGQRGGGRGGGGHRGGGGGHRGGGYQADYAGGNQQQQQYSYDAAGSYGAYQS